jgi:hypothetical protein
MTSIVSSLETDNSLRLLSEEINNFAFTFIAPLSANNY